MALIPDTVRSWSGWPAITGAALALIVPASGLLDWHTGGLAPLAVALLVSLFLATPLAVIEGHGPPETLSPPAARGARTLSSVLRVGLISLFAATLLAPLGAIGILVALAGWAVLVGLVSIGGPAPAAVALLGVGLWAMGAALAPATPWTLLEPQWWTWSDWAPGAVVAGLLAASAGLGQWPTLQPGRYRLPWFVTGITWVAAVLVAIRVGGRFEALTDGADPWFLVGSAAVGAGAAATVLAHPAPDSLLVTVRRGLVGLILTLWLLGPGHAALPLLWHTVLPLGIALWSLSVGFRLRQADDLEGRRPTPWLIAGVALVAAILGWPGWPGDLADATLAAITLVACVWWVGTPALLARRQPT